MHCKSQNLFRIGLQRFTCVVDFYHSIATIIDVREVGRRSEYGSFQFEARICTDDQRKVKNTFGMETA